MKVFKKKSLKLNNAGMTLIELLVAIAIMAVALAPLLYAFVNVARYNTRAREVQQTTTLAHTVMENCKAYSMEDIDTQMSNGTFLTGVTAAQTYNDTGTGTYYMTNVALEGEKYDIALKFTPRGVNGDATTSYDIIETQSMNRYLDAVFTPEGTVLPLSINGVSYGDVTVDELDQIAYIYALQAISDRIKTATEVDLGTGNGVVLTESQIEDSFKNNYAGNPNYDKFSCSRKTTIWLADMASFEAVEVLIAYTFDTVDGNYYYKHTFPDGTERTYTCSAGTTADAQDYIYTNSLSNDASHPTQLENVYFFYYPGYNSYGTTGSVFPFVKDEFLVSNTISDGTRELNVYLLKQKNPAYNDTNLGILEANYKTYVESYYPVGISSGTNIYHNFDVNLGGGGNPPYDESTWFESDLDIMPELIETDNKVLMYDIELTFYDAGAYNMTSHVLDPAAQPVLSMDGTTLDW